MMDTEKDSPAAAVPKLEGDALLREIVRFGTMAPSSHNTQCWKFKLEENAITVLPDFSRRCPVVDPDDHHLYVTLGCAIENLAIASRAHGRSPVIDESSPSTGIRIDLSKSCPEEITPLFNAIEKRQCTYTDYDGTALTPEELELLEKAGSGNGVKIKLVTEKDLLEQVLEWVVLANTAQMENPLFMDELKSWIRYNKNDAEANGDGLYGACKGNPSIPKVLGPLILKVVLHASSENDKIARHVRSSSGIAIFVSEKDDPVHWVEAGRCYERFALQATVLGIKNAFLNQPVEESSIRPKFAEALSLSGARPDLVARFGRAPEMPRSHRRPVDDVLVLD